MSEVNHELSNESLSDAELMKHVAWVGVLVAIVALGIGWVANTVA